MRKIIGITGPSQFTPNCLDAIANYFDAAHISLSQNLAGDLHYFMDQCDAIILAGGRDIHPRTYSKSLASHSNYRSFDIVRDRRETKIIRYALKRNIPLLGICRGHQMLGVYHGMNLIADLNNCNIVHNPHREGIECDKTDVMHKVLVTTEAQKLFNFEDEDNEGNKVPVRDIWVNSYHHQAIEAETVEVELDEIDEKTKEKKKERRFKEYANIDILGFALGNKSTRIVELMKSKGTNQWLSCQWHPEFDYDINPHSEAVFKQFANMIKENERTPRREKAKK